MPRSHTPPTVCHVSCKHINLPEKIMGIILWLLGVPLSVVLLLMLFGVL